MSHFVIELRHVVDEDGEGLGYFHLSPDDHDEMLGLPWIRGVRFDTQLAGPVTVTLDVDDEEAGVFADVVNGPVPLVSARVREALEACGVSNVEYFDVVAIGAQAFVDYPRYYAINIVGRVAAADSVRSVGLEFFGGPGATLFDRFVPAQGALDGIDIARMYESPAYVIVSERVCRALDAAGADTLRCVPLDQWRAG